MSTGKAAPPLEYPKGQKDAIAQLRVCCPTCGGPWKSAKRVCRQCGRPISSRHKWQMIPAGPGLWAIEHRNCDDPGAYTPGQETTDDQQV